MQIVLYLDPEMTLGKAYEFAEMIRSDYQDALENTTTRPLSQSVKVRP